MTGTSADGSRLFLLSESESSHATGAPCPDTAISSPHTLPESFTPQVLFILVPLPAALPRRLLYVFNDRKFFAFTRASTKLPERLYSSHAHWIFCP
jgi:hypothetical protein